MHQDVERLLISEEALDARVKELGKQITEDYKGKKLLLVCILKGSCIFAADIMRAIDLDAEIEFMKVSSYGSGTASTGNVRIVLDLEKSINEYNVLLIEDILDTGNTLHCLKNMLNARRPESLKICTLLDKPSRRTADIKADYIGFEVEDEFVVGYGLDYNQMYRNLPYVGILKRSVYEK